MINPIDVFKLEGDQYQWIGDAPSVEESCKLLKSRKSGQEEQFLIKDSKTDTTFFVKALSGG